MGRALAAAALCLLLACATRAAVIYVDCGATSGANDGESWTDAYTDLQGALTNPSLAPGDEIWVAEGTYVPTDTGDRPISFVLVEGVGLYGGFVGTESARDERDSTVHETTLSGDLLGDDDPAYPLDDPLRLNGENSYHVVIGASDATIDGFTVTGGSADGSAQVGSGAGMWNENVTGLTVANCTFTGNLAVDWGGGMHNGRSSLTVTNCSFTGNSAHWYGGGMHNAQSSPTVTDCTFSGNWADWWGDGCGGGMRNALDSSPTVTNCTFTSNSARSGGAMDNYSGSSPAVTNCTFTGNTAESGGGMHNGRNCSPAVTNCTFTGNTADSGGGMRSYLDSSPTVVGCTFSDNRAREYGGGMDNIGSLSPLVSGCIFVGNTAGVGGGGMSNGSSSPALTNCTFSGNRAASYGGGMSCAYSFPTVANCILWGNSAPDGPEIWTASNASCTVTYSCIAQSDGFTDGGGNFDLDPLFVDPGHWDDNGTPGDDTDDIWIDGDYRLQPGSPCIDRADGDAAPEFDIEGNPRHDDPGMPDIGRGSPDHVDIGAYEFQGHSRITPFAGGCMPVSGGCGGWLAGLAVLAAFASALRRRLA